MPTTQLENGPSSQTVSQPISESVAKPTAIPVVGPMAGPIDEDAAGAVATTMAELHNYQPELQNHRPHSSTLSPFLRLCPLFDNKTSYFSHIFLFDANCHNLCKT